MVDARTAVAQCAKADIKIRQHIYTVINVIVKIPIILTKNVIPMTQEYYHYPPLPLDDENEWFLYVEQRLFKGGSTAEIVSEIRQQELYSQFKDKTEQFIREMMGHDAG